MPQLSKSKSSKKNASTNTPTITCLGNVGGASIYLYLGA